MIGAFIKLTLLLYMITEFLFIYGVLKMITSEFILSSLIIILIPGTGAIFTITTGISNSTKASVYAAIGCTLGILPHLTASILGLSAIMNMSAHIFSIIRYIGVAYLLYLAWSMWKESGTVDFGNSETKSNQTMLQIIVKAITINLLNPKLTIFFFSFLPLFLTDNTIFPRKEMTLLSLIFMGLTLIVFILYGLLASSLREFLIKSKTAMKRVQQSFALILAGFAVKLAISNE